MSFELRNEHWNGTKVRVFLQPNSKSAKPRLWSIQVLGNVIHTTWGQQDGAMQEATDILKGVNIGKKNEMSPEAYALDRAKEMARKKDWEGYREIHRDTGEYLDPITEKTIDFDNLPLALSFYKPDNSMGAGITKKAEAGKVWYARKRNGLMFVLARGTGSA
jgi:hypothetical protein